MTTIKEQVLRLQLAVVEAKVQRINEELETAKLETMLAISGEVDRESDGRWIFEVAEIPGCMSYGATMDESRNRAIALAVAAVKERALDALDDEEPLL